MPAPPVPPDQRDRQADYRRHHPPEPAPASGPSELELAGRCIVWFANVTDAAADRFLELPSRWAGAVSADPGEAGPELNRLIGKAKDAGRVLHPWCDCREPDGDPPGTPFTAALAMREAWELDEPIGEAESVAEYDHAIGHGARLIIGNLTALDAGRQGDVGRRVAAGELGFVQEALQPSALRYIGGMPIAGVCMYPAGDGGAYTPLEQFLAACPTEHRYTFSVWHAAGLRAEDWQLLD